MHVCSWRHKVVLPFLCRTERIAKQRKCLLDISQSFPRLTVGSMWVQYHIYNASKCRYLYNDNIFTDVTMTSCYFTHAYTHMHTHTRFDHLQESARVTDCGQLFDKSLMDQELESQAANSSYLVGCRGRRLQGSQSDCMDSNDVIIMSSPSMPPKTRMKLLQFHTNVRPAYFGSWRKKSKTITGRTPLKMDMVC